MEAPKKAYFLNESCFQAMTNRPHSPLLVVLNQLNLGLRFSLVLQLEVIEDLLINPARHLCSINARYNCMKTRTCYTRRAKRHVTVMELVCELPCRVPLIARPIQSLTLTTLEKGILIDRGCHQILTFLLLLEFPCKSRLYVAYMP